MLSEIFFFKQKTAYERRISDWSSDVCSSDLPAASNSATEQSLRSLMLVENDARTRVLFMSSVIDNRRLQNTSMPMGSARTGSAAESVMKIGRASCSERVCTYV